MKAREVGMRLEKFEGETDNIREFSNKDAFTSYCPVQFLLVQCSVVQYTAPHYTLL